MNNGINLLLSLLFGLGLGGDYLPQVYFSAFGMVIGHQDNVPPRPIRRGTHTEAPISVVEEYFLALPADYLVPPGANRGDFSESARQAILAKSAYKPGKVKIEVLDPANGYLRFVTMSNGGKWVSEMACFSNSLKEWTVAVNHVWYGQHRFTHSIFFLEDTPMGWLDRTAGVVPDFNASHPAFAFARVPLLTVGEIMPSGMQTGNEEVAKRCVRYVLPRKGKELVVQRAHATSNAQAADSGSVVLFWKEGVFGPEHSVLDDYAGLDGAFLEIDKKESFRLIPLGKDNIASRMKCVVENHALNGKIRIGPHPSVHVHEGNMELTRWQVNVGGQHKEILVLIGTDGLDGSPCEVNFLELVEGKWVLAEGFRMPVIDLDHINALYSQLPAQYRMIDRIGLHDLSIESEMDSPAMIISLKEGLRSNEIAPVLMRMEFDGRKWQISE